MTYKNSIMKITKSQLKRLIKEELENTLSEIDVSGEEHADTINPKHEEARAVIRRIAARHSWPDVVAMIDNQPRSALLARKTLEYAIDDAMKEMLRRGDFGKVQVKERVALSDALNMLEQTSDEAGHRYHHRDGPLD